MALGFGGSSSKSKTQSNSFTNVDSFSNQVGGNFSQSQQGTFIAPGQNPYLQSLYGNASGLAQQVQPQVAQQGAELGAQLGGIGQQQLENLGGIAGGSNPFMQALLARSQGSNPYINQQIASYGNDIARQLQSNILPQIGQGFATANQFGGGRQGLAEGLAIQESMRQFGQGAQNLRSDAYAQGAGAAGTALQAQLGASRGALGALPGQFELGMAGPMAGFLPMQQLGGLLGDPTVLSQGSAIGGGFDLSQAASQTRSESSSKSKSKGSSASFGL
jgi:hypothetical protein